MPMISHMQWPAIISLCIGTTAAIIANMIDLVLIGMINSRVPEGERVSYAWQRGDVRNRFKTLYPGNKLIYVPGVCAIVMVVCFISLVKFWVLQ